MVTYKLYGLNNYKTYFGGIGVYACDNVDSSCQKAIPQIRQHPAQSHYTDTALMLTYGTGT